MRATDTVRSWLISGLILTGFIVGFSTIAPTATAAASNLEDCIAIQEQQARLDCYDKLHGRDRVPAAPDPDAGESAGRSPAAPAAAKPPAQTPETRTPASAAAGDSPSDRSAELGVEQLPKPPEEAREQTKEMIAGVTDMGKLISGRHWFRLDNGQLWEQVTPERAMVKVGDSIRVSRALTGSYHLRRADGGSRSTQVRRRE